MRLATAIFCLIWISETTAIWTADTYCPEEEERPIAEVPDPEPSTDLDFILGYGRDTVSGDKEKTE